MASIFLWLGSSFFMAETGSVAPVSLNRRYASARRILGSNDADVSHRYRAIPENSVKDANNPSSGCPNGFEHLG